MKDTYQIDTSQATPEAKKLYSCGQAACFAAEVENSEVTATSPVGWRLRGINWPSLVFEMASQGVIITKLGGRQVI